MMNFDYRRKRIDTISEDKKLEELEKAAKQFNYFEFSWRDFNNISNISASAMKVHFGSWKKALEALRNHLHKKGINLSPRPYGPQRIYSDRDLFGEMERIWLLVGQRPSRNEWEMSKPKISLNTYKKRFGSWSNACLKFIEYKMGKEISSDDFIHFGKDIPHISEKAIKQNIVSENSRNVPLGLRIKVLERDNFKCVLCGRSPVTDFGIRLHIDHIHPFTKGGKSTIENLQTLCEECNLGKSDKELNYRPS